MSGRAKRARGRPPRTPISTGKARLLRKPKAFGGGFVGENSSSRSSTPVSISPASTPTRGKFDRGRAREAAHKGRNFIQSLFDDDELSRDSLEGTGSLDSRSVNFDEDDDAAVNGSDDSFDEPDDYESDYSVESTGNSSTSTKKKVVIFRRPKSPEIPFDQEVPPLVLPQSSNDLLIPTEYLMQCIGIYEVLRHFRTIARLSPFSFEDFCASLLGEEQCTLHTEIHVNLIKAILREEDANTTTFGPSDVKDSINISLFFLDGMTWPEVFRAYLESDKNSYEENKDVISVIQMPDFPFVSFSDKLKVLQNLSDLFLSTNRVREEILHEGNIQYDDHCRACHKLGDLLCCETCSAVYHLACVDPPLEEVPDDDWLCSICKAHQVKGVTDCISEAERSGMLCRQEPLGYDRHGRKYWFLSRRLIVEGENEVWYYSTPPQIAEVLEEIDKDGYERELYYMIRDLKDDIMKQMKITEELTNSHANSKKTAIEVEKERLAKIQEEREARRAREEEERRANEEEERQRIEEEARKAREALFYNGEELLDTTEEVVISKSESSDTAETSVTKETSTTTATGTITTVEEIKTTTTTKTSTVTSITHENGTKPNNLTGTVVPRVVIIDSKQEGKTSPELKSDITDNNNTDEKVTTIKISEALPAKSDSTKLNGDKKVVVLSNSQDSKPNTTIMNIQSVCPNSKATILKTGEKLTNDSKGTTVVVLNKDGGQLKFSVAEKGKPLQSKEENGEEGKTDENEMENGHEKNKYVTRSKTGSLTPKLFSDSVMGSTTVKTVGTKSLTSASTDEVLVINKDGEITRVTRSRLAASTSIFNQQQYFKLGMDGTYKQYVNQYSTQTLALNKHQHNEERDKRRYLSHKFSLTSLSEFKWHGTIHGNKIMTVSTIRLSLLQLENSIASPFLHPNWQLHRQAWQKALQKCSKPEDFALALSILEASIKPVLLLPVWHEALGHVRLKKITSLDREEMKKKEKEQRKVGDEESQFRSLIWIKYTLGLKHQVWKQRGEEYRVSGGQGWIWMSSNKRSKPVDMHTVGLRAVAKKLQARKRKVLEEKSDDDPGVVIIDKPGKSGTAKEEDVKMDTSETVKTESDEGEIVKTDIDLKEEVIGDVKNDLDVKEEVVSETSDEKPLPDIKDEVESNEPIKSEVDLKEEVIDQTDTTIDVKEEVVGENEIGNANIEVKEEVIGESSEIKQEADEKMDISDKTVNQTEDSAKIDTGKEMKSEQNISDGQTDIDVESVSPRKELSCKSMKSQGNVHLVKHNLSTFSLLTDKADVELIDVSKAITEHTYYPKITKPYAKLDHLLERRLKMKEAEKRQRDGIEQQIQWKLKLEAANNAKDQSVSPEKKIISLPVTEKVEAADKVVPKQLLKYECYSPLCKIGDVLGGECYSVQCRYYTELEADMEDEEVDDTESVSMEVDDDCDEEGKAQEESESTKVETNTVKGDKSSAEDEEIDIMDDHEDKTKDLKDSDSSNSSLAANQNTNNANSAVKHKFPVMHVTETKTGTNVQITSKGVSVSSNDSKAGSDTNILSSPPGVKRTTTISIPGNLAQMIAAKGGTTLTMSQAQQLIRETLEKMTVEDLRAKVPPERKTCDKIKLLRMSKLGVKRRAAKKTSLPIAHKFKSPSGTKSLFILEKWETKKLAKRCGRIEVSAFKYDCKMNNVNWPYPCPRPLFKTAFRYRMQTVKSLAGAALGLRVLWACVRWDDMSTKAPAGGTNTISTETEITTTELVKRRDVGPFNLRSEFLVRKIVVPLGVPQQPKEKYTPQRSGLRERKRADSPKLTEPSVTEKWEPEERLELWEIKMFGEKVEKQRAALQEKLKEQQQQKDAVQIKHQMEEQLKQQRAAMQQKRVLEGQPKVVVTTGSNLLAPVMSASPLTTTAGLKGITTLAPNTVLKAGAGMTTLLSSGNIVKKITTVQPKTTAPGVVTTTSTIRPMVKVQIPGSTVTLRPAASGVTLAPKPPTQEGAAPVNSVATPTLTAIKMPKVVGAVQTGTGVSQVASSNPGHVQNVQIVQGPQGQLQVRGLLQGQQIVRLPDGRLQLITVASQAGQAAATSTQSAATSTPLTAVRALQSPAAATTSQTVLVSSSSSQAIASPATATSPAAAPQTKVIIPSQGISSLPGLSQGTVAIMSSPQGVQGSGTINVLSSGGQTVAKIISPTAIKAGTAQVIQKVGGGNQVVALASTPTGTRIIRQITPQIITGQPATAQIVGQHSTPQIIIGGQQSTPQIVVAGQSTPGLVVGGQNLQQKQQQLQQQKQLLAQQQAQLQQIQAQVQKIQTPIAPGTSAAQPTIQATAVIGGQPQTITVTAQQLAALQQQQQIKLVQKPEDSQAPTPGGQPTVAEQLLKQQEQRQQGTSTSVTEGAGKTTEGLAATSQPPTPVKSVPSSAQQKYAVTPQVVQEVVRQALLQNQAPEIQAKLLALQKHMTQQKPTVSRSSESTSPTPSLPETVKTEPQVVDTMKAKPKPWTQEQKDEQSRLAICGHVIKGILDKIEREEKQEQKRQKKQESVEEKHKRMAAAKIQGILFKHKEALKKEIQRKRALSEKNINQEIQMEIAEALCLQQPVGSKRKAATQKTAAPGMVLQEKKADMPQQGLPPMPPTSAQVAEAAKAKKKKQKIISTGGVKPLNPKRKLYCVCKTPYDESRFYIGCDLCSNWFHGECVNISEDRAKYIDAFICDDCKRQQETATEELYCLCRTPYDESQFYIGCDRCQDWFHGHCVGITEKEANQLDTYICPNCQRKDSADPTNLKELTDTDYELLHRLMKSLLSHKMAWPFIDPVDPAEVPDYYDVIKDPMDLSTVEVNLDNRVYRRLSDFIKDVTKIFNNCRLYNPPDTPFFQCAEVVETFFAQRMKSLKDKLLHTVQ